MQGKTLHITVPTVYDRSLPDPATCPAQEIYRQMVIRGRLELVRYQKLEVARPTPALRSAIARCTSNGKVDRQGLRALVAGWTREQMFHFSKRWVAEGEAVALPPRAPAPEAAAAPPPGPQRHDGEIGQGRAAERPLALAPEAPAPVVATAPPHRPLQYDGERSRALRQQAAELRKAMAQVRAEVRRTVTQARLEVSRSRALGRQASPILGEPEGP